MAGGDTTDVCMHSPRGGDRCVMLLLQYGLVTVDMCNLGLSHVRTFDFYGGSEDD